MDSSRFYARWRFVGGVTHLDRGLCFGSGTSGSGFGATASGTGSSGDGTLVSLDVRFGSWFAGVDTGGGSLVRSTGGASAPAASGRRWLVGFVSSGAARRAWNSTLPHRGSCNTCLRSSWRGIAGYVWSAASGSTSADIDVLKNAAAPRHCASCGGRLRVATVIRLVGGKSGSTSSGGSGAAGTAGLSTAVVSAQLLLVVTNWQLERRQHIRPTGGVLAATASTAGSVLHGATVVADLFWWLRLVRRLQSGLVEHLRASRVVRFDSFVRVCWRRRLRRRLRM
jgi:hypothetical protein